MEFSTEDLSKADTLAEPAYAKAMVGKPAFAEATAGETGEAENLETSRHKLKPFKILIMKKYLLGILAIAMAVGFSAFTSKSSHKKFAATTFYWKSSVGSPIQEKADGLVTDKTDVRENSVLNTQLGAAGNFWTTNNGSSQGAGDFLAAIRFDLDNTAADGADGALTLAEAATAVQYYFDHNSQTLPAHGGTFIDATTNSGCVITIKRATAIY